MKEKKLYGSQFLIGTVLHCCILCVLYQIFQVFVSIPHRYGITLKYISLDLKSCKYVSIPHRYGITFEETGTITTIMGRGFVSIPHRYGITIYERRLQYA